MNAKEYREAYVASQIDIGIPFQIRALRKSRGWNQELLAKHAKMAQPRISEIESPGERRLNIETLLRIAAAFDVGLQVRFLPFSELIEWSESFDPENFQIKSFQEQIAQISASQPAENFTPSNAIAIWDRGLKGGNEPGGAANAQFIAGQQASASPACAQIIPFPYPSAEALTQGTRVTQEIRAWS